MATIKINDAFSVELLSAESGPGSGFSKYFKGNTAGFLATTELANALNKSIATLSPSPLGLGFSFAQAGEFGSSSVDWTLQAGAKLSVGAAQSGTAIPGDRVFANPIQVAAGQTFVGIAFSPTLALGLSAGVGEIKFGFNAGASFEYRSGRFYDVAAHAPQLGEALLDLLTTATIPGDLSDIENMKPGDVAAVSGAGQFKFSASFNIAQAINPLATPVLGLQAIGALKLEAGASLTIGASVGVSGRYQIRVQRLDADRFHLGLYKMAGTQFQFDVKASAGLSASLGKMDLTAKLLGMLGAPRADTTALVDAGLSDAQIDDIKNAIEASLSRSISLSLAGSFATSSTKTAVFEYEFSLSKMDAAASEALHRALDADFTALTSGPSTSLPAGIRLLVSELETVKKRTTTWRINLLGILNVLSVTTLVKDGKVLFDTETGELTVTDSATAKTITVITNLRATDRQKLRKVLLQSAVLSAAYRASGIEKTLTFDGSISYFDRVANATRQNVSDFLDNLVGLTLITDADKRDFRDRFQQGPASVLVEAIFNQASFDGMFADTEGNPKTQEHYDNVGRQSLALLVQPGDPDDFRRSPMLDDDLWKLMTDTGQPGFAFIFGAPFNGGVPLAVLTRDYTVIRWWSKAMSTASRRVAEMKDFLAGSTLSPEILKDNMDFIARRRNLHNALAAVVSESTPDWEDAWGVLAMYIAARRIASVRGILLTDGPILAESRP